MNIELLQLSDTNTFVNCFKLKDNSVAIVESEFISNFCLHEVPLKSKYEFQLNKKSKTLGYSIAAHYYYDALYENEYFILLKDTGYIEILTKEFVQVELFNTEVDIKKDYKHFNFIIDEKQNKLYLNLEERRLYSIDLKLANSSLKVVEKESSIKCIYETSSDIIQFDGSTNLDHTNEKEFFGLSILTTRWDHDDGSFKYSLIALQFNYKSRTSPFITLINERDLELDNEMNDKKMHPQMKLVPNVGIFLFTDKSLFFYEHLLDIRHHINDILVDKYYKFDYGFSNYGKIVPSVQLTKTADFICFSFSTTESVLVKISMNLLYEHPEEYVFYWSQFQLVTSSLDYQTAAFLPSRNSVDIFFGVATSGTIYETVMIDDHISSYVIKSYKNFGYTCFYSQFLGYSVKKLINCMGSFATNNGLLKVTYEGYNDFFSSEKCLKSNNINVTSIWKTKTFTYWQNEENKVYKIDVDVPISDNLIYISKDDEFVENNLKDEIINITEVNNDISYCYITNSGDLKFSNNNQFDCKIRNFKGNFLSNYKLFSLKLKESYYTLIANESSISIIRDSKYIGKPINVGSHIADICLLSSWDDNNFIVATDIHGLMFVIKGNFDWTSYEIEEIKLTNRKLKIHVLYKSRYLILYSSDTTFIMSYTGKTDEYSIHACKLRSNIKYISSDKDEEFVDIVTNDNKIYEYEIKFSLPELISYDIKCENYILVKSISLACSLKYVISCTVSKIYDALLKKFNLFYQLQVFDLDQQLIIFRYDLSNYFPKSRVSDMIEIAFNRHTSPFSNKLEYAKELVFNRCFVISLDNEEGESYNLPNILLLTLDEETGFIELQTQISTEYQITTLKNCLLNKFIAAGEELQIFEVDFFVNENTFKINKSSNNLITNGFFKDISYLSDSHSPISKSDKPTKKKHKRDQIPIYSFLVLDYFKGLKKYSVFENSNDKFIIKPIPSTSNINELSLSTMDMITSFAMSTHKAITFFAICVNDKTIYIYNECGYLSFRLPHKVINISCMDNNLDVLLNKHRINLSLKFQDIMFVVSTEAGGCYFIKKKDYNKNSVDVGQKDSKYDDLLGIDNSFPEEEERSQLNLGDQQHTDEEKLLNNSANKIYSGIMFVDSRSYSDNNAIVL